MPNKGEKIELEIRHYGKSESSFMLYDDDGETFNYEKGEYSWTELSAINSIDNQLVGKFNLKEGNIFNYNNVSWKFMTE